VIGGKSFSVLDALVAECASLLLCLCYRGPPLVAGRRWKGLRVKSAVSKPTPSTENSGQLLQEGAKIGAHLLGCGNEIKSKG